MAGGSAARLQAVGVSSRNDDAGAEGPLDHPIPQLRYWPKTRLDANVVASLFSPSLFLVHLVHLSSSTSCFCVPFPTALTATSFCLDTLTLALPSLRLLSTSSPYQTLQTMAAVDPATRKRVLRVVAISLLLDLVSLSSELVPVPWI